MFKRNKLTFKTVQKSGARQEQIVEQNVGLDINTLSNFKFSKYIFNETSISLSMIPNDYISSDYIELLNFYLSKIISIFKEKKGRQNKEILHDVIRFYLYKIAYLVLIQPNKETKKLFCKILEEMNTSLYLAALLLRQLSYIAEYNNTYTDFWLYWKKIANASMTIINESSINSYDYKEKSIDELIESLLFSWVDWDPKYKGMEWIEHRIVDIENFVAKTGQNPDVVEAILKLYDHFTKKFRETGLFLMSNILKQHSVKVVKLGVNSRYYLERSVQHLINSQEFNQMRVNRHFIRELLFVLDSLIEMGSSQSYFLRERVLVNS
jgi:hypothetical protein